jgi:hypothetical protein
MVQPSGACVPCPSCTTCVTSGGRAAKLPAPPDVQYHYSRSIENCLALSREEVELLRVDDVVVASRSSARGREGAGDPSGLVFVSADASQEAASVRHACSRSAQDRRRPAAAKRPERATTCPDFRPVVAELGHPVSYRVHPQITMYVNPCSHIPCCRDQVLRRRAGRGGAAGHHLERSSEPTGW